MKAVYLGIVPELFKENYKKALMEFYGDDLTIDGETSVSFIFKIPFAPEYFARIRYNNNTVFIGSQEDISGNDINTDILFNKSTRRSMFTLLVLNDYSITLFEGDPDTSYGGPAAYSIADTDKGLIFFSSCKYPSGITASRSIHVSTGKDLTPILFGNQYVSKDNEVLKQPLKFTDTDGVIYTCKDMYNISYKPGDFTVLPKSYISNVGGANKTHPDEKFNTSILIYDEED